MLGLETGPNRSGEIDRRADLEHSLLPTNSASPQSDDQQGRGVSVSESGPEKSPSGITYPLEIGRLMLMLATGAVHPRN